MSRGMVAGLVYFGIVFAVAFALGTVRVLVLVPTLGELAAVLAELPILLVVSWMVCSWAIARFDVPATVQSRLIMGGVAFTVLMIAELGGSMIGFGRTLSQYIEQYRTVSGVLGLTGQVLFAAIPLIQSGR
jgi:hypothetical protein